MDYPKEDSTSVYDYSDKSIQQAGYAAIAFALVSVFTGILAFFIFRRSRFAAVAMLVFVVVLQLYGWFVAHSPAGTIVSIIVVAFLVRGARRIFQDHAERQLEAER